MTAQSRPIPLLLTRPDPQGARFGGVLARAFGDRLAILPAPLMAPQDLTPSLPTGMAAVIFTSESAVHATARHPARAGLPTQAWCVGDRTAAVAAEAGFKARSAQGDAAALVRAILAAGQGGPLLHLRGADTRGDLAQTLTDAGLPTAEGVIYAQGALPLPQAALELLQQTAPVIVPLFSPRSAQILADQLPGAAAPLWLVALSPAVAKAASALRPARLILAKTPDAPAMVAAIDTLLSQEADLNPMRSKD